MSAVRSTSRPAFWDHSALHVLTLGVRLLLAGGGALGALLCWLDLAATDLPGAARATLGVTCLAGGLWASEAVSLPATAVLATILLYVAGAVQKPEEAFSGFASPVVFFLLGSAALGIAAQVTGLMARVADWLLGRTHGSGRRLLAELLLSFPVQAFVVPSATSRNTVLVPTYVQVLERLGRPRRLGAAIMLALAVIGPFASSALLSGGVSPVAAAAAIGSFTWLTWFVALALPYYVLVGVSGLILWLLARPEHGEPAPQPPNSGGLPAESIATLPITGGRGPDPLISDASAAGGQTPPELGAGGRRRHLSAAEWRVVMVSAGTALLWMLDALTGWPPAIPALLALTLLLAPRVGVMQWRHFADGAPWSTCFMLAGATSLANALTRTGAAAWTARRLFGVFPTVHGSMATACIIFAVATAISLAIPGRAAVITLTVPLAIAYAAGGTLSAPAAGLVVMLAVDAQTLYPAQTTTSLIAYESGYFGPGQLFRFNVLTVLATLLITLVIALPWWSLVGLPGPHP